MNYAITASIRTNTGRRAHLERHERRVPAVVYGPGVAAQTISVPQTAFEKLLKQAGFSSLVDLTIEGQSPVKVVIKELQRDHLTMEPMHVDFHQIRMDQEMTAEVPLTFIGESPMVKSAGGTLVKSLDSIQVTCLPANLPHEITVDLSTLASFEDHITVGSLVLPQGVTTATDVHVTIATVARPLTEEELKKLEEGEKIDVTAVKTEAEEKREAEAAKKAAEDAIDAK